MILTCYRCPRQICFAGGNPKVWARSFGWVIKADDKGGGAFLLLSGV